MLKKHRKTDKELNDFHFRISCNSPWQQGPDGICVLFVKKGTPWQLARDHCRSLGNGIDLVTISNDEQNSWIAKTFDVHDWIWNGANDLDVTKQWRWSANNKQISFTKWEGGHPVEVFDHDCISMNPDGTWVTNSCRLELCYICQKGF